MLDLAVEWSIFLRRVTKPWLKDWLAKQNLKLRYARPGHWHLVAASGNIVGYVDNW